MIEHLRLTVLVENQAAAPDLRAEHGLALWLEADEHRILLDTGAGTALLHNAARLGIDVITATALVLSHGHNDHSGAITKVLALRPDLPCYLHPAAMQPRYSRRSGQPRSIGMPSGTAKRIRQSRCHISANRQTLDPDIWLSGEIPRAPGEGAADPALCLDRDGRHPDPLRDDQALVIRTRSGLVVVTGCCHAGIEPTLRQIRQQDPDTAFAAVIGGLHLKASYQPRIAAAIASLQAYQVRQVLAGHCTGTAAEQALQDAFGRDARPLRGGSSWCQRDTRLHPANCQQQVSATST
jgi:7,8-dihydropterin-6-yl-methyl-4-(beta-D-ribofuranosyl)aminobenzene 5'-phosphate synthase